MSPRGRGSKRLRSGTKAAIRAQRLLGLAAQECPGAAALPMPTPGVSTQTPAEPEQEGRRWDNLSTWERSHLGGRKPPVLHPLPCPWDPGAPTSCYRREGQGDRGQGGAFPPGAACFGVPPCSVHTPRPCSRSASSKYSSGFPPAASPPPWSITPILQGHPAAPQQPPKTPWELRAPQGTKQRLVSIYLLLTLHLLLRGTRRGSAWARR